MDIKNHKILLLIIVGILVFGNVLWNGFVWDDEDQILLNDSVHSLTNFPSYFLGSTFNRFNMAAKDFYFRPVMTTVFAAIYTLVGPNAWAYHFIQMALHIANSILVYLILKRLLKNEMLSWFLAAVFLVHPINAETVVYIANYQEVLFLFFGLLSVLVSWPMVSAGLLLLSLLSKETGIIMVAITICYYFFYRRKALKILLLSLVGTLLIYSLLRFGVAHLFFAKQGLAPISTMPFVSRLVNIPAVIFFYVKSLVWPANLAINQKWVIRSLSWTNFTFPLIVDAIFFGLLGFGLSILKRQKSKLLTPYLFFGFWFFIALVFHLHLFPLDSTVTDRWFYLPLVGLLGIVGSLLMFLKDQLAPRGHSKYFIVGLIFIILFALAARTFVRTFDWRSGFTLYSSDIKLSPDAYDLENNYGVELLRMEKFDEAAVHIRRSIELQPRWWINYNNLGAYYEDKGDLIHAESAYKTSIENGQYYLAYQNLGFVLVKEKKNQEAIDFLEKTIRLFPQNPQIVTALALAYHQAGQKQKALFFASYLFELEPTVQHQMLYQLIENNAEIPF